MSARRSRPRRGAPSAPPTGPLDVDTGAASFDRVPGSPQDFVLTLNGVPSSPYRADDPQHLGFDYLRWMSAAIAAVHPEPATLRAVHIGGAACALPRHLEAARPGSRQTVVEVDAALVAWVRAHLDLPRSPALALRAADGAQEIARFRPDSIDAVVRDAFAGDATPAALSSTAWFDAVRAAVPDTGVYVANVADDADRTALRTEVEALRSRFRTVVAIADGTQFRRRRRGNVVVFATDAPLALPELEQAVRADRADLRFGRALLSHLGPAAPRR